MAKEPIEAVAAPKKRKNNRGKGQPTRIWSFGCKEPPNEQHPLIFDQMRKMLAYRNRLVEIEVDRRGRVAQAQRDLYPDIERLQAAIEVAKEEREEVRTRIKRHNQQTGKKQAPQNLRDEATAISARIKEMKAELKEYKAGIKTDQRLISAYKDIDVEFGEIQRQARHDSGVYWGCYLAVEKEAIQSFTSSVTPPKKVHWRGTGKISMHFDGGGLSVARMLSGNDKRFKLVPYDLPRKIPQTDGSNRSQNSRYMEAWIRIGMEKKDTGKLTKKGKPKYEKIPIFATAPVLIDREFPEDGKIKDVYLQAIRIGVNHDWHLKFFIGRPAWEKKPNLATEGCVGVDLGWRLMPDRSIRVAYWSGDDGEKDELTISAEDIERRWRRPEAIRSERDKLFDEVKTYLQTWMRDATALPDWLLERTGSLSHWRSQGRLAALILHWRQNRFPGDDFAYSEIERWRREDKYLAEIECNIRRKAVAWRNCLYARFVQMLREKYRTAYIEKIDWRAMAKKSEPEFAETENETACSNRQIAAVGKIKQLIMEYMNEAVQVPPENTTKECHLCGTVDDFDAAAQIEHTCSGCGVTVDQDLRASIILRARGTAMVVTA